MASVNKVILVGRVGKEPELKSIGSSVLCSFSIATSEKFKGKDGPEEKVEWTNVKAWGKLGELCSKYLSKGSQCYIEGKLETRSWDDKITGQKRYATEVLAQSIQFLSPKAEKPLFESGNVPAPSLDDDEPLPF